jgi:Carboxypeptidase regulatory-like domain
MTLSSLRQVGVCFAAVLFCGSMSYGQTTFGSLTGTATDPSGAVIPGVQVALTNLATSSRQTTTTNADGIYEFVNVLPGTYSIEAEKPEFKHFSRFPVVVQTQQSYRIDIAMQVGAVTQTVSVTTATPLLQPQTSSLGQVIAGRSVSEMPLNARNVLNLMELVPSVVPQGEADGTPTGENPYGWNNYQINGAFGGQSAIYADGVPVTGSGQNNNTTYIPIQDSVQEFKVQTDNLGPEWGLFSGGVMNFTTKSGTNQIHGEAYEYLRNQVLNSNTFFGNESGISTPPFTQNQFGANAGGSVHIPGIYNGKDRTFWFFAWEGFRLRQGVTFTDTMPTAAELQGDFSQLEGSNGKQTPIYNPLTVCGELGNAPCAVGANGQPVYTRQQFPGNVIPSSMLNLTALKLESLWAKPNTAGQPFTNVNNFTTTTPTGGNNNSAVTRIDHSTSDKQHIFGRYTYWNNLNLAGNPLGTGECLNGECQETYHTNAIVLDDTFSFTPTLVSDIHVGFDRFVYNRTAATPTGVDLTTIGWPASYNARIPPTFRVLPNPSVSGMASDLFSGDGVSLGSIIISRQNDWYVSGDLTKISGRHTLNEVAQLIVLQDNYAQTNEATGSFCFNSGYTASSPLSGSGGFGFASFLLGYPSGGGNMGIPAPAAGQQIYAAEYFGDTWQVSRKLTLNLGLRYDQPRSWTERFNRMSLWNLTAINPLTASTVLPAKGELCLVDSPCRASRTSNNPDDREFAPRLGFAYRVTHNTVLRGGYGVFWMPTSIYVYAPTNSEPLNVATTPFVSSLNGGITPLNNLSNPFPNGILEPPGRSPTFQSLFLGQSVTTHVPNNSYPYMQQWNFDVQRQLPKGFFLDAAYAGSKGTDLSDGSQTINQLPDSYLAMGSALLQQVPNPYYGIVTTGPLSSATVAKEQLLRPYPQYNGVGIGAGAYGDSIYSSFQLKVQRRFRGGGTLLAAYTNAKLITDTDLRNSFLEGSTGGVASIQDWNCIKCSYSLSSEDVPQRLVISYAQDLPFGQGQRFLPRARGLAGKLVSGWGLDGITTFQRGFPLKLGTSVNLTNSDGGGSLPNVVPGCVTALPGSLETRLNHWFNTACFTQPPSFTFGDESRVDPILRMQGINGFDVALFKTTNFGPRERLGVQFRAEFFNLFNTAQFGPPGETFGTPQFGVVSSQVNNPRLVQFALKFLF